MISQHLWSFSVHPSNLTFPSWPKHNHCGLKKNVIMVGWGGGGSMITSFSFSTSAEGRTATDSHSQIESQKKKVKMKFKCNFFVSCVSLPPPETVGTIVSNYKYYSWNTCPTTCMWACWYNCFLLCFIFCNIEEVVNLLAVYKRVGRAKVCLSSISHIECLTLSEQPWFIWIRAWQFFSLFSCTYLNKSVCPLCQQ